MEKAKAGSVSKRESMTYGKCEEPLGEKGRAAASPGGGQRAARLSSPPAWQYWVEGEGAPRQTRILLIKQM